MALAGGRIDARDLEPAPETAPAHPVFALAVREETGDDGVEAVVTARLQDQTFVAPRKIRGSRIECGVGCKADHRIVRAERRDRIIEMIPGVEVGDVGRPDSLRSGNRFARPFWNRGKHEPGLFPDDEIARAAARDKAAGLSLARTGGAENVVMVALPDDAGIVDGREVPGHALIERG